jgi:hypothetical protein
LYLILIANWDLPFEIGFELSARFDSLVDLYDKEFYFLDSVLLAIGEKVDPVLCLYANSFQPYG